MHERGLTFQWQDGYGAFSVSPSQLDKVTAYIRNQREHHKKVTFEQEFLALLKKGWRTLPPQIRVGMNRVTRRSGAPGCWGSP